MARFYARFDSGSAGWTTELDGTASIATGFDRRRIAANSSSAALLRDGLIASRSAVSADVYDDLDAVNEDGSKGTYFPPDLPTYPSSTLISWSTAYTSSVDGIKFPVTNSYGSATVINYSRRPTASIVSTQTTLTVPTNPVDPVQLNYNVYLSASTAVRAVLDQVQNGAGTVNSPYTRLGTPASSSRTLASIWHDPDLQYFAWDDFTPGPGPNTASPFTYTGNNPLQFDMFFNIRPGIDVTYVNDANKAGYIGFEVDIEGGSVSLALRLVYDTTNGLYGTHLSTNRTGNPSGDPIQIGLTNTGDGPTNPAGGGGGTSTWSWIPSAAGGTLRWANVKLPAGTYTISVTSYLNDPITKLIGTVSSIITDTKTIT